MVPDVSLADLHGESADIAEEFCSQRGLGGGEGRKLACVTFSRHFDHSEIYPQVEYCKNRCHDGEPDNCTLSDNFYSKGPFES